MTIVEFIEKDLGVELLDWQKKMLAERAKEGKAFRATVHKGHVPELALKELDSVVVDFDVPGENKAGLHLVMAKGDTYEKK